MGTQFRPYQPETITRTLLNLRAQIVRDGGPGREHVEALLALRGNNLAPVPRKANVHFRRNRLRLAIRAALRDGPLTGREIVERVCAAHGLAYGAMYRSVYAQLGEMKKGETLVREDGSWRQARKLNSSAANN